MRIYLVSLILQRVLSACLYAFFHQTDQHFELFVVYFWSLIRFYLVKAGGGREVSSAGRVVLEFELWTWVDQLRYSGGTLHNNIGNHTIWQDQQSWGVPVVTEPNQDTMEYYPDQVNDPEATLPVVG